MSSLLIVVLFISILALTYAAFNFFKVKKMPEGSEEMSEIAKAIRIGANAFINYEYKIVVVVAIIIAILLSILVSIHCAIGFLLGASLSALAGYIGMRIATYANVRVSNTANETKNLGKTLKVAFQGGSVMGLCVGGFALLGVVLIYLIFGIGLGQLNELEHYTNWLGITFIPFTMTFSGYALGCSIIAIFNRIGGGIYTKAADMGADLVGKTEANIPEDDPRNPATIADNVGDNVGDVAGLGSDLLESYVGALSSCVILGFHLYATSAATTGDISIELLKRLYLYPVLFAGFGLLACCIGIASLLFKKNISTNPHKELNSSTYISACLTIVGGFVLSNLMFKGMDTSALKFKLGYLSPFIGASIGIVAGILIGAFAEYYTSTDYKPTKDVAKASIEGPALTITQGLALGMKSCMLPCTILGIGIIIAYTIAGFYGVAMSALGMLSFVSATVSVDTYGPISDNAGGIAEMSNLGEDVREITDELDSVGNTTAAIGKGFAIGSGGLAALALMISYLFSFNDPQTDLVLNIIEPMTLAGGIIGAALPFIFSGILIEAVAKAARKMVDEVRRQFKLYPGILNGTEKPDYKTCIEISSKGAIGEMKIPSVVAVLVPVVTGFIFGPNFVGGILIGSTLSAIMLAIFTGNAGGAWDNGKKYIETGAIEGNGKGSQAHKAAVVGDTVGDPLKDTVGPCLDIFIKIMANVSLVAVSIFSKYNIWSFVEKLLNK